VRVGGGSATTDAGAGTTTGARTTTATATETERATGTRSETEETESTTTTERDTPDGTAAGPDEAVRVGADGRIGLVPSEDAVKLEVDAAERGGARRVRVEDDAAGRVFDAPPVEREGRAGVYVHRAGGYTVEVTDERGETSVERVNPGPNQNAAEVAKARTGVSGITRFLVEYLTETRETVERLLDRGGGGGGTDRETDDGAAETGRDDGSERATATPAPNGTATPASGTGADADADATIELEVQSSDEEPEDGDDGTATQTASPESTATPDATRTATPTSTPTETETPTPTPDPSATGRRGTASGDALRSALDEAVSQAQAANEAALANDDAATAEALRALRAVLERLSSFGEREDAPQPAARIAARKAETADRRAARALDALQ
jgi:hypothetical protein